MTSLSPMLSLSHARKMIERSIAAADAMNVACSIAITGPTGRLASDPIKLVHILS